MTSKASPSLSERYHAATIYTHESLRQASRLDFSQQPSPFKRWHQARQVPLAGGMSAELPAGPGGLDAERLGHLLFHTYGVTLVRNFPGMSMHMRAAPSAGGLYPAELYVAVRGIEGIPDGLLDYHAPDHALALCWEGDFWRELERYGFGHPAIAQARAVLIATGVFQRSAWRYAARGYRRVLLDAGHMVGNALLAAPQLGQRVVPIPDFADDGIDGLLLLDPAKEATVYLAAIVDATDPEVATPPALRAEVSRDAAEPDAGDWIPAVHQAGALVAGAPVLAAPAPAPAESSGETIPLNSDPLAEGTAVLATIRRRRSTRHFQHSPLPLSVLGRLLAHAYPSVGGPPLEPDLLRTHIVISNVEGVPPGVLRYHPGRHVLERVRSGSPRRALYECCLRQDLGRDAAIGIVHSFDLPGSISRLGERAYRTAHLEAGIIGQRLNVGAVQLGYGVSGIGGFFDDSVSSLLGLDAAAAIAYITTIGLPA